MEVSAAEEKEVDRLIALLKGTLATTGRAGALVLDRRKLRSLPPTVEELGGLPDTLAHVARSLSQEAPTSDEARRALRMLAQYVSEAAQ